MVLATCEIGEVQQSFFIFSTLFYQTYYFRLQGPPEGEVTMFQKSVQPK
jgi:hypothetical protein